MTVDPPAFRGGPSSSRPPPRALAPSQALTNLEDAMSLLLKSFKSPVEREGSVAERFVDHHARIRRRDALRAQVAIATAQQGASGRALWGGRMTAFREVE